MSLLDAPRATFSRLVPRTLGTRLALTYSVLVVLILAILGWSIERTVRDFSLGRLQTDLLEESSIAGDILQPLVVTGADSPSLNAATRRLGEGLNVRVTLVAADGEVLADSEADAKAMENHAGRPEIQQALKRGVGVADHTSATLGVPFIYVARAIADGHAVVRLGMPKSTVNAVIENLQRQIAAAALVAGILMIGAGWFVAQRITSALGDMQRQANAVASGRLDVGVEPAPTQELGDLGRAFNAMTARLRASLTELERVRTRLEVTLADLSDGVIITDERGRVVLANGAALEMLAVQGDINGEPLVEAGRDHELADLLDQALSAEKVPEERVIHHGRSGKILQAAARRLDAAGERIGVVVLRDLTELRRLEGVRRDFVANVSHELRTPLTSIRALVETLEAGAMYDAEVSAEFLSRIISEVDRLAGLVDELLDLARLEAGRVRLNLEPIDAEAAIRRAIRRLAPQTERAHLVVEFDIEPGIPSFVGDRDRVDQVLLNVLHNAIKFTPSGGTISLQARRINESIEFQVSDTGIGVDPEDMPRLFERFYKADRARGSHGTGLGLAIAKHIVHVHGGAIGAAPNTPRGTVFTFSLPIAGPGEEIPQEDVAFDALVTVGGRAATAS